MAPGREPRLDARAVRVPPGPGQALSEPYEPDNLLDRRTPRGRLEAFYAHLEARERALVGPRLPAGGDVVSIGAGWHPGRHLFPAPAWRLLAVDSHPARPAAAVDAGVADAGLTGRAGRLDELAGGSFDAVLCRFVLHHVAYSEPLRPVLAEAGRLLRPGGILVAVEPGLWHPVGLGLALANRSGLGVRVHGTPDDVPLSPRRLVADARAAGLDPELHAVTYAWRRLPVGAQRALWPLDRLGSAPGARALGHTLLLLARPR